MKTLFSLPIAQLTLTVEVTISSLFTKFCYFPFGGVLPKFQCYATIKALLYKKKKNNNNKINADATLAAFEISLIVPSIPLISECFQIMIIIELKFLRLSKAKNIFTPANINSIVILLSTLPCCHQ